MKRAIICLMLLALMLTGAMSVHATEAEVTVQVRASETEVSVGDAVEFTVLATGSGVVAMQFNLELPEGLSYVPLHRRDRWICWGRRRRRREAGSDGPGCAGSARLQQSQSPGGVPPASASCRRAAFCRPR